jgi:glycosyltransferase involved in cell wall biosynthesis
MRILFIHNNFPGQYRRILARIKNDPAYELLSASLDTNSQPAVIDRLSYRLHREPSKNIHPAARYTESAVLTGQAVLKALLPLKRKGWSPDIVLSHAGWGNGLFIKDLWPQTRVLSYFEWYYNPDGEESGYLQRSPLELDARMRTRLKNTAILQELAAMDWGQSPTMYQRSQFPDVFHERISVLHDGIDTDFFSPLESATFTIGDQVFRRGDPLITYIARGMEPYRGFPQFIEAVSRLQRVNSDFHAVVIGTDRVAYGANRQDGKSWKEAMLEEHQPDLTRLHFLGHQPLHVLRDVLRVSAAHIYLTVPFVLSWSMMEAMSTGALVIGSNNGPVQEMIRDGENGYFTDFFDVKELSRRLRAILDAPNAHHQQRANARETILRLYREDELTPRYLKLISSVASGERPIL